MHPRHADTPALDAPPLYRYGLPEYVKGQSPAAGAAFTESVGGAYHQRLVSLFVRLVTDATVANRSVFVEYLDGEGNRFAVNGAPVDQAASSTNDWWFSAFQTDAAWPIDSTIIVPLSPILLPPTFSWKVSAVNLQAGDALSRVRFVRERFYTADPGSNERRSPGQ